MQNPAVRNTLIVIFFNLLGGVLGYLVRLLFARNLTPVQFGLFYAVYSLIGLFSLFRSLGLNEAVGKYIAHFTAKRQVGLVGTVIRRVIGWQMVSALFLSVIFWFLADWLALHYFHDPGAARLLHILTVSFVLMVLGDIPKFIYQGLQRMTISASVNPLKMVLVLSIAWLLFTMGWGVDGAAWAYLLTYVLLICIYFLPLWRFVQRTTRTPPGFDRMLISFGIPVTLSIAGYMIIEYTDVLILTYFRTLTEVGLYSVAIPTSKLLMYFAGPLGIVVFPLVAELFAKGKHEAIAKMMEKFYTYATIILFPMAITILVFPEVVIRVLFGEEYLGAAFALQILTGGAIAFALFTLNASVFAGMGKPKITSSIVAGGALLNLGTCFLLVPRFGIIGAAATTAGTYILLLIVSSVYAWKLSHIHYPIKALLIAFCASIIFLILLAGLKSILHLPIVFELLLSIGVAGIIYLAILRWWGLLRFVEIQTLWKQVIQK